MHRPVRRNALNQLYKIDPTIFPLLQANYENCVPNIIPCELRFCMIFENNAEISTILRCADFVSMLYLDIVYRIPSGTRNSHFSRPATILSSRSFIFGQMEEFYSFYRIMIRRI